MTQLNELSSNLAEGEFLTYLKETNSNLDRGDEF